jgi:hypothetical protein
MSTNEEGKNPKLFVSYSWSSPEHEQWVLNLATSLVESGVEVILDKWDLREGHDSVAFMEKMATDPSIKKVAMISDKVYADKADGRSGGVGTETQIISRNVYENQKQEKFVAVLPEKDENGKPYLPEYFKGKIYIDLSNPEKYVENFELLLRWIYDKPLYVKPQIGVRPAFLNEVGNISLGTSVAAKRAVDAIRNGKSFAFGSLIEYFTLFQEGLENFRVVNLPDREFDDVIFESIEGFKIYRDEFLSVISAAILHGVGNDTFDAVHKFFEKIALYMWRNEKMTGWSEWSFDNYKFIIHELFLYTIAICLRSEKFEFAEYLLSQAYYIDRPDVSYGNEMDNFSLFRHYMRSLEYRNSRLKLNRLSLRADMLKNRSEVSGVEFKFLMQADFVLFVRALASDDNWWPETLLYASYFYNCFEIFARASSVRYFDKLKVLLAVKDKGELEARLRSKNMPKWEFDRFDPFKLAGIENLCTRP